MRLYPIMLKIAGWRALVVGGGPVALRKVRSLTRAGAEVTMVTQEAPTGPPGDVDVITTGYTTEHLAGIKLVFACTNDPAVNARIANDARKAGAIVNCVDQPEDCDFFVPAVVNDDDVVVAVGTGGASPALAGRLKENIADALPERIGLFARLLGEMREQVKASIPDPCRRNEILKTLSGQSSYTAFLTGGREALAKILSELIS